MTKTISLARVGLCVLLGLGGTMAAAQQTYDPMRPTFNPLAPPAAAPQSPAPQSTPNPEFDNLPDGVGAEETYYQCIACHSTAIIRQQNLTDARWDYLWTWMIKEQGMYDPEDETKEIILTYLKTHFSSER